VKLEIPSTYSHLVFPAAKDCFLAIDKAAIITLKELIQRITYYAISVFNLLRQKTNLKFLQLVE